MALTTVRAKLGDSWIDLTYNPATGRYEGEAIPEKTSFHQPEGYFPVTVAIENETGDTAEISGDALSSLRLVVRETAAPVLTLISPSPGYLTTQSPTFVFEAVDEDDGSGVDPGSFSLEGASAEAVPGGYRFTWSPPEPWTDGPHTLTASIRDHDGNESAVSGAWIVDTIPPALYIKKPYMRHVVDEPSITIAGTAWDTNGVEVLVNGVPAGREEYAAQVPLEVGENHIPVTARDGAGLETSETVYIIRLITDRTKADVDALNAIYERPMAKWTEDELKWFNEAIQRGAYNDTDMNRVGIAVRFLAEELRRRGYAPNVQPKTDWTMADAPTLSQGETYRKNVETIRDAQGLESLKAWPLPRTLRNLNTEGANALEKALVETDKVFPRYTAWTSGEISCGEV